ncbi:MAG TPA: 50S ribosomal protein L23 [Candidatus Saccharimonadales bacterium]|nr:50S ribosomal protein L23 [Candidatus Saccharimonadales bacterium]
MNTTNTIVSPVITERSMNDAQNSKFTFIVALNADKNEIKRAIEDAFKVHVIGVSTVIIKGKTMRVGKKRTEKTITPVKKAIVALTKGEKIDLFDLGEKK